MAPDFPAGPPDGGRGSMTRIAGNEGELHDFRRAVRDSTSLGPTEKLVLYTLSFHYPDISLTQASLAAECCLSTRTTRYHLRGVISKGWVTREVVYNRVQGSRAPTRYELVVQA
jgi:hypothetical protein